MARRHTEGMLVLTIEGGLEDQQKECAEDMLVLTNEGGPEDSQKEFEGGRATRPTHLQLKEGGPQDPQRECVTGRESALPIEREGQKTHKESVCPAERVRNPLEECAKEMHVLTIEGGPEEPQGESMTGRESA
eukprot:1158868-Pelagomonas_calceolata.AAC.1